MRICRTDWGANGRFNPPHSTPCHNSRKSHYHKKNGPNSGKIEVFTHNFPNELSRMAIISLLFLFSWQDVEELGDVDADFGRKEYHGVD